MTIDWPSNFVERARALGAVKLARELGVASSSVYAECHERHLLPLPRQPYSTREPRPARPWPDDFNESVRALGAVALSRALHVATAAVYAECSKRGLLPLPRRVVQTSQQKHEAIVRRFWTRVRKPADSDADGCWLWTGGKVGSGMPDGYGVFKVRGKTVMVHRFAYELLVGPIPDGQELHHVCENTLCVRPGPEHVQSLTVPEHRRTGEGFAAREARQTHCKHGHPLEGDNLFLRDGKRVCRTCRQEICRKWRQRQKRELERLRELDRHVPATCLPAVAQPVR
jgi:hypothetical protein